MRGRGLALTQLSCSEAGSPNFCAHQNRQGTCSEYRFLGPTTALLAQDVAGAWESAFVTKGSSCWLQAACRSQRLRSQTAWSESCLFHFLAV